MWGERTKRGEFRRERGRGRCGEKGRISQESEERFRESGAGKGDNVFLV